MLDELLFAILVLSPWFADIANYLVLVKFWPHLSSKEKNKIMRKSAPFTWIRGNLFKLSLNQILRQCVIEEEVFDILLTYHDGPCGGHFAAKRTTFKGRLLLAHSSSRFKKMHQPMRLISKDGETYSKGWDAPTTSSDLRAIWEVGHVLCQSYQPSFKT